MTERCYCNNVPGTSEAEFGSGQPSVQQREHAYGGEGRTEWESCPACNGSGQIAGGKCSRCNGKGKIPPPDR